MNTAPTGSPAHPESPAHPGHGAPAAHIEHDFVAERKWLTLPVKNGAPKRVIELWADGEKHRWFDIELACSDGSEDGRAFANTSSATADANEAHDANATTNDTSAASLRTTEADWHAFIDIAPWRGRRVQLRIHPPAAPQLTPSEIAAVAAPNDGSFAVANSTVSEAPKSSATATQSSVAATQAATQAATNARLLAHLHQSDNDTQLAAATADDGAAVTTNVIETYREALRPQFHFSSKRGWLNDPNGLVYHNGEYHLFYQHNPYGTLWGNMHWGHAVSPDLVHWRELDIALHPDRFGTMFSGCAVVDWHNTSGLAREGKPLLILLYTAAGDWVQGLAYSHDGRTFTKLAEPVVPKIVQGNRDPKVIWHAPSARWIMALYAGTFPDERRVVQFLASTDLKSWTQISELAAGPKGDAYMYECPDFFELPIDGDPTNTRWILIAANSAYAIGHFDGTTFTPEVSRLNGQRGHGYFAAQTFSDEPNGRRIEIGWWHTHTHASMPFNQSLGLPTELKLQTTTEGVRLTRTPVVELAALRHRTHDLGSFALSSDSVGAGGGRALRREAVAGNAAATVATSSTTSAALARLADIRAELLELRVVLAPGSAREVRFKIRGVSVIYDADRQELVVNEHRVRALLDGARQTLAIYVDRIGLEIFAGKGEVFVPFPINLDPANLSLDLVAIDGACQIESLTVHELKSAWR